MCKSFLKLIISVIENNLSCNTVLWYIDVEQNVNMLKKYGYLLQMACKNECFVQFIDMDM